MLNEIEQRLLGVLIEKSLTQPDGYPLTLNSLLLGANQKQNRDPVREYSESDISNALRALELKQLVSQAPPSIGARSVRFRHHVVERFHWDRREQAVMAELLLRGRQTPGELRTHAGRMSPFGDLESVVTTLNALRAYQPPYVEELPREPGRSANRFRHLLAPDTPAPPSSAQAPHAPAGSSGSHPMDLESRIARLEVTVARLEAQIARLTTTSGGIDSAGPETV